MKLPRGLYLMAILLVAGVQSSQAWPDTLWTREYNLEWTERPVDALQTRDGGFAVLARVDSGQWPHEAVATAILRLTAAGNSLWERRLGGTLRNEPIAFTELENGTLFVATRSTDSDSLPVLFHLLDTDGEPLWSRALIPLDLAQSIVTGCGLPNGQIALVSKIRRSLQSFTIQVTACDTLGQIQWQWQDNIYTDDVQVVNARALLGGGVAFSCYWYRTDSDGDFYEGSFTQCAASIDCEDQRYGFNYFEGANFINTDWEGQYLAGFYYSSDAQGDSSFFWVRKSAVAADPGWERGVTMPTRAAFARSAACVPMGSHEYMLLAEDGSLARLNHDGDVLAFDALPEAWFTGAISTGDSGSLAFGHFGSRYAGRNLFLARLAASSSPAKPMSEFAPQQFQLYPAYPNPFNPSTTLAFDLSRETQVRLDLYDVSGRHVETLADEFYTAGRHTIGVNGSQLAAGVYFCRLDVSGHTVTQKVLLLK